MGVMNEDRLTLYDGLIKTHITNTTVAKETGKGLSTNDYTTTEKNKLAGIADGANKTIVDSALDTSSTNPVQNKVIAGEINTLKKSVSDGKTLVATAITDKGVDTAADATFAVMAENIGQIETGGGELHGATISVATNEENPTTITVTLTKDSTTIGQKNFDSNGLCTFTDIQESGDYTITASNEDISNSTTVTITGDNIVNKTVVSVTIDFTLDGSTATPLNDVSIWLRTDSTGSSLNAGHTTLAEVIADTTTLSSLMADESAMNYLARSTGFAEEGCASETFMTYLGASTYVDSTVLNSDIWVSSISSSTYWDLVYPVITVHSSASATITVAGKTFTSDTSGNTQHSMPWGIFSISDSVSGQSFERTIGRDTTDVYVMPEGALYWYGFINSQLVGNFVPVITRSECYINFNTNNIVNHSYTINQVDASLVVSTKKINVSGYTRLIRKQSITREDGYDTLGLCQTDMSSGYVYPYSYLASGTTRESSETLTTIDISNVSSEGYLHLSNGHYGDQFTNCIYACWLE